MKIPVRYDMPDDYRWMPGSARYPLYDTGELAARLKSIVTYDRRGEVLYIEDGSTGWNGWRKGAFLGTSECYLSADFTYGNAFTYRFLLGGAATEHGSIWRYFKPQQYGRIGYEFGVNFPQRPEYALYSFRRFASDGAHSARIKIDLRGSTIYYQDYAGDYIECGTKVFSAQTDPECTMVKVVVDFQTNEYVRILVEDEFIDLTGVPLNYVSAYYSPRFETNLTCYKDPGYACDYYVVYFILTGNEP